MKKLIIVALMCGLLNAVAVEPRQQEKPQRETPQVQKPAKPKPPFPRHWGKPPAIQTRDMVKLPGKFGMGSSTLASWISDNIKRDVENRPEKKKPEGEKPEEGKKPNKPKPPVKPVPPIAPLPPVEIKEKMDSYKETQRELQGGLRSALEALGKKPSREEVRKTLEKFRVENKDTIDAQKELGKTIQEWQKENRPERPKKPEPSAEIKEKMKEVHSKKKEMDEIRKTFQQTLKASKDLTKEQRDELIKEFKETNAEKHQAIKEAQKELQKEIREIKQDGDRRK
jgi:Ca2+-binding EF-hand superfamily protein